MTNQTPPPVFSPPATVGEHNAAMSASTLRIVEGGSWKHQETVVIIPSSKTIATKVVMSWLHLIFPPNQPCPKIGVLGMEVGDAYSQTIEAILAHPDLSKYPYILTLESDNTPAPDGVLKLLAHAEAHPEFACIGGLYWTKGPGGVPQIWGDPKDPLTNFRPQPPDPRGGLVECCGTGMGFNLWRTSMFHDKRIPRPLFRTKASMTEGAGTQDLSFWAEARKYGYRCAVACDVLVGHYDASGDKTW